MNPFEVLSAVRSNHRTYVQTFQRFQNETIERWIGERIENGTLLWKPPYVQLSRPYAPGTNEQGEYMGLVIREVGPIYFDAQTLLVHPDHMVRPPGVPPLPKVREGPGDEPATRTKPVERPEPEKRMPKRYYGRVRIDAQRVNKDIAVIVEEVVQRLTSQLRCEVEISLEIEARKAEGFDEGTVRTISENSRTLKFEHYAFEE